MASESKLASSPAWRDSSFLTTPTLQVSMACRNDDAPAQQEGRSHPVGPVADMALRAGRDDSPAYRPQTRTAPVWDAEAELWKFWTIGAKLDADNGRSSYHESRDGPSLVPAKRGPVGV